ncbi:hypothetical protein HID58_060308, partial [Brassica napus]
AEKFLGWYYFGFSLCNKKVFKEAINRLLHIIDSVKDARKMLLLCHQEAIFILLDLVAKGFITEAATKLLNGSFDEIALHLTDGQNNNE